jgi:hypothetical protein
MFWNTVLFYAKRSLACPEIAQTLWKPKFITVFRRSLIRLYCEQNKFLQASHPTFLRSILIISSYPRPGLSSVFFL